MKSILFNSRMVTAIIEGRKTQARRVVTPQPNPIKGGWKWRDCLIFNTKLSDSWLLSNMCPYGKPGSRLWLREAGVHMPKWVCRTVVEITDVRMERLQDITEEDARAEGITSRFDGTQWSYFGPETVAWCMDYLPMFGQFWDSCFPEPFTPPAGCGWSDNPWVWAISFQMVEVCNA